MNRSDFKKWMKENDLNEVDVASALKMHPITITRYLEGRKVQRSTEHSLERLMTESDPTRRKEAVG